MRKKKEVDLKRVPDIERWADHALISYLKIIVAINRNQRIINYRTDDRLTQNGARDFKVRMGFGLHAGWAIEGAVGSLQKVALPLSRDITHRINATYQRTYPTVNTSCHPPY